MVFRICKVLIDVCAGGDAAGRARAQRAVDAGAIEAVVEAMRAHPQVAGVQGAACGAVGNVCHGADAAGPARRQRAAVAGGRGVAAAAMQAHPDVAVVQRRGQRVVALLSDA